MSQKVLSKRPWEGVPPTGRMLRPVEVAARTGLSRSTIYALIAERRFPPFLRIGGRASAMPEIWLQAYVDAQARRAIGNADAEVWR